MHRPAIHRIVLGACLGVAFFGLVSCHRQGILYSHLEEIGKEGWSVNDPIKFSFSVTDTTKVYDLLLDVSHSADYAWQNLYVQIETDYPQDSTKTDIISLEFSDRFGGWEGRCGSKSCTLKIPLQLRTKFPMPGDYALIFNQYMRQDLVPGIQGFRLTVAESAKKGQK